MKKLAFIFLLFTQVFFAQSGFEIGNALYQKGNYEGAITAYENVLQTKKQSAELYFNLGNCYYKLNKVAPAIYNYEKALVLNPGDTEIQNNLRFAHKMTIDEIKDVPKVGFAKMLRDFTGNCSYDGWAWMAVSFAGLFCCFSLAIISLQPRYSNAFFCGNVCGGVPDPDQRYGCDFGEKPL
jgi:tetratricopeptide (TPR) repeat protein